MILNHKKAIEFLIQSDIPIGLNSYTILNLHALLANNLLSDPKAIGSLRINIVGIKNCTYQPLNIPQKISEIFDLMLKKVEEIKNPFEQSFFIMTHLPYLQPFEDVNKRVSRLAANIPLIQKQLVPLSFVDMPREIYLHALIALYETCDISLLKDVFMWAYERSAKKYTILGRSIGEPNMFYMKYHKKIHALISHLVSKGFNPQKTSEEIKFKSQDLPKEDQDKFIEIVERELLSLHEGNLARYQINNESFKNWQKIWHHS